MHDDAAAEIGAHHGARIAQRGAVEFAVANQHNLSDRIHYRLCRSSRELLEFGGGPRQFDSERNFAAADQRCIVEIETARANPVAGA